MCVYVCVKATCKKLAAFSWTREEVGLLVMRILQNEYSCILYVHRVV
jgi:hypothetical protein